MAVGTNVNKRHRPAPGPARFNYYGMRAVLSLYLVNYLSYSQDQATTWIHVFTMLAYFFPIFGPPPPAVVRSTVRVPRGV